MKSNANGRTKSRKDEAYWNILSAAIELETKKGFLKWTITELSRKSGVTRSLIYYYFGRSKMNILEEAVKLIGEEFIGLSERRIQMWKSGEFYQSVVEAYNMANRAPYLCNFYLSYRDRPNEIGERLRDLEGQLLRRIHHFLPTLEETQVRAIASIYFGLVFYPLSDPKTINHVVGFLEKVFGANSPYLKKTEESSGRGHHPSSPAPTN